MTSKILKEHGEFLGGLHLEASCHDITECIGGKTEHLDIRNLKTSYMTYCDPRLNRNQCLDLITDIKEFLI